MTHTGGRCGEQQTQGTYRWPHEADLPIREGLYHRSHEETREVDHRVQGTGDDWSSRGVDAEVIKEIFEQQSERRFQTTRRKLQLIKFKVSTPLQFCWYKIVCSSVCADAFRKPSMEKR